MEEAKSILSRVAASLAPPPPIHVIPDLSSSRVCVGCIFRLFGIRENAAAAAASFCCNDGLVVVSNASEPENVVKSHCSICLGILEFACESDQKIQGENNSIQDFTLSIAELIKAENYQIDGFSLEVSVPPLISANERAIWLYMKNKYGREEWFKERHAQYINVKDALKSSITHDLEKHLDVKPGVTSFRIRLTYTHSESSTQLKSFLGKDTTSVRRKTANSHDVASDQLQNESDAVILKAINNLQDEAFSESFQVPPQKVYRPCQLTVTFSRTPIYIGGRYLKFSRKVSQSRWIIDDERMGESSVEEIIGSAVLSVCRGDNYKFHAAGREDIDVRMLGSGRPFLVEVCNARCVPSVLEVQQIAETINNSSEKYVRVKNLKLVGSEVWNLMREGETEKQKQYAALIWTSRPLTDEDIQKISSTKDLEISQPTPIRVLHRRSPLERKRIIHWMKFEKVLGRDQYYLLHLCTQAGTYIKEFVHGDLGRTQPSIGSIVGCRAEIVQLDVTDVKMDGIL